MKLTHLASTTLVSACLVGLTGTALGQNLITNGSFEDEPASVVAQTFAYLRNDPAPIGWTYTQSAWESSTYVFSGYDYNRPGDLDNNDDPINALDGLWYADLNAYGGPSEVAAPSSEADYDSLSQQVQTTAGVTYALTYYVYGSGRWLGEVGTGNYFNVTWDGQVIPGTQISDYAYSTFGYLTYQEMIVGDGGTHTIAFNGFGQYADNYLDDVSLVAQSVPEPNSLAVLGIGVLGFFIKRRK